MQYISTSDKDTIVGFIAEAKRIKIENDTESRFDYLEVIDIFINNQQMATSKIFVIIKEYLHNKDITKYKNELLYSDLVTLLLDNPSKI